MSTWTHPGSAHFHTRMILREMKGLKIMCKMMGLMCKMMGGNMAMLTLKWVKNWLTKVFRAFDPRVPKTFPKFPRSRPQDKNSWHVTY